MTIEAINEKIAAIESDPAKMIHLPKREWNRYLKLLNMVARKCRAEVAGR